MLIVEISEENQDTIDGNISCLFIPKIGREGVHTFFDMFSLIQIQVVDLSDY